MLIYECRVGRLILSYLYPYGTDVFSSNCRLLKNEFLYNFYSGSVIIDTKPPPAFLLRFIFFDVNTVTCYTSDFSKIISLMTSKLTNCKIALIQCYPSNLTQWLSLSSYSIIYIVDSFWPSADIFFDKFEGF